MTKVNGAVRVVSVELPSHLCLLARSAHVVQVRVEGAVTQGTILDELEAMYPVLAGTIREHTSKRRRPFLRFFACGEDLSHQPPDEPVPEAVATGTEPFLIVGAIAGGC